MTKETQDLVDKVILALKKDEEFFVAGTLSAAMAAHFMGPIHANTLNKIATEYVKNQTSPLPHPPSSN